MGDVAEAAHRHLGELVGLSLSASRRVADMRIFDFGGMHKTEKGEYGEYALHVQCAWRLETESEIITGRHDLFMPAEETKDFDWESWDWTENETRQDRLLRDFFSGEKPVVKDVATDAHGGAAILLSGNLSLVLFPCDSQGEDWRLFRPRTDEDHFVISGGRVEDPD